MQVNKATVNMMRVVEPYIAWGYPNLKTVRELIYKRGYGKVNKDRIPLTDNAVVEKVRFRMLTESRYAQTPEQRNSDNAVVEKVQTRSGCDHCSREAGHGCVSALFARRILSLGSSRQPPAELAPSRQSDLLCLILWLPSSEQILWPAMHAVLVACTRRAGYTFGDKTSWGILPVQTCRGMLTGCGFPVPLSYS